jgi:hypothetical protein
MALELGRDKTFTFTFSSEQLAKGLRHTKRNPRNSERLTVCKGAVGRDGILQILDELKRLDTSAISTNFPYPQIFVFIDLIIVCSSTKIYEWDGSALVEKLDILNAHSTWSAVDFYEYIYMSNGGVAVFRNSTSGVYTITESLPSANAMVNFNGQVIIGGLSQYV